MGIFKSKPKKPESRVTDADKVVLQLKQQRDKLKQYRTKIQIALEKERVVAKQLLKEGKTEKAKLLLRKKKFQEGLIDKTEGQLENIEQMVHDLEFTQIESKVLEGLKQGNASLKKMHDIMSLEDVEKIMDETADAVEYQRQISDLVSGGLSESDESEVLDELEALLAAESEGVEAQLPDVPDEELPEREREQKKRESARGERTAVLAS